MSIRLVSIANKFNFTPIPRCYGNRQSLQATNRSRLATSFENEAEEHPSGAARRKKNPVGNFITMIWDKNAMTAEVARYIELFNI